MDRMGVQPILHIKASVAIDKMFNFDGHFDRHGDSDLSFKQTLQIDWMHSSW